MCLQISFVLQMSHTVIRTEVHTVMCNALFLHVQPLTQLWWHFAAKRVL